MRTLPLDTLRHSEKHHSGSREHSPDCFVTPTDQRALHGMYRSSLYGIPGSLSVLNNASLRAPSTAAWVAGARQSGFEETPTDCPPFCVI